jgi:hypothetical protein
MGKITLTAIATLIGLCTQANAMYTQCTVQKTLDALDRPNGQSFFTLDKGDSVTIEGKYKKNWVFVHSEKVQHWGWVLRNVLTCEE